MDTYKIHFLENFRRLKLIWDCKMLPGEAPAPVFHLTTDGMIAKHQQLNCLPLQNISIR